MSERRVFHKRGDPRQLAAEREGLLALAATAAVRVPAVFGHDGGRLDLEFLDLRPPSREAHRLLGEQLAALHRHTGPAHGWQTDNFIGATPQPNGFDADWAAFFLERRLGFQLALAERNGIKLAVPLDRIAPLLAHQPSPSLLHGDLWAGNHGMLPDGTPVIFDPAVHYGDRECDLAMADLFGGYGPAFFDAYEQAWPLPAGWEIRRAVYQLYHVLNHLNLFGGGYLGQVQAHIRALSAG